jgi:hypothetical protein
MRRWLVRVSSEWWGKMLDAYVRVPVQFSQRSWLESNDRGRDGLRYREIARVDDLDGAAATCCDLGLEFACFEDVGAVAFEFAEGRVDGCGGEVGLQDVGVGRWDGVEDGGVDA